MNLTMNNNLLPATYNYECSCDVKYSKTTQKLMRVAIDIFGISRNLQWILEDPPTDRNFQQILDENEAVGTLLDAAQTINEVLHAYADDEISLSLVEFDFGLRSIHFIKNHLIHFDHLSSFLFTSLPKLITKRLNYEMKLKLVAVIAEYSHDYKSEIYDMNAFFEECEALLRFSEPTEANANCLAFMGLMFKRLAYNERGNKHLKRIYHENVYKVVYLKYLATKTGQLSAKDLVNSIDENHNPQNYIRSMQVTETFYRIGYGTKILSAALQAIFEAKQNETGQSELIAFITDVLHICQKLGLQKQTVNLLLKLGSLQLNEPDQFSVIYNEFHFQID